jgi:hypothetical protein
MLLKLVDIGIDLDAWEVKRKQVYDERTDVNRQLKEYQIKVDSVPAIPDDTPDKEMNIQLILIEYENARQTEDRKLQAKNRILEIDNEIIELSNERIKLKDSIRIMPTYDLPEIQNRLNNSEQINKNVRLLKQYNSDTLAFETYQKNVETLNSRLEQMDKQKNDAIESANFPISGNPNLRVIIIKEGSLLDHKNLELVKQMVKDKDYQLWIECVDDSGKLGIVIEDGQVKEQPVCQDPRLFVKDGELHKKNETELEKHGNTEHVDIQSGPVPDNMGESKKDGGWF